MNRFNIKLYPEMSKTEDINLEPTLTTVKRTATEFSENGRRATNRKWIEEDTIRIDKDVIQFVLVSDAWLQFPTKAIRGFISQLSKIPPYNDLITSSGRLFKGESELIEEEIEEQELSDEQTLIEVTKLFFRETEENRNKINQIKMILGGEADVLL